MNKANETKEMFSGFFGDIKNKKQLQAEDYEDEYYDEELGEDEPRGSDSP
jgi:hypothetical protein